MAGANTYSFDMIESLYNDWLKAKNNTIDIGNKANEIGQNIANLNAAITKANAEGNGEAAEQYALQIQNQQAPYFSQLGNQLAQAKIVEANALKAYNDAKAGLNQQEKDAATALLNSQAQEIKAHQDLLAAQAAGDGKQATKEPPPAAADANYASGQYMPLIIGAVVVVIIIAIYFFSKKAKAPAPAAA